MRFCFVVSLLHIISKLPLYVRVGVNVCELYGNETTLITCMLKHALTLTHTHTEIKIRFIHKIDGNLNWINFPNSSIQKKNTNTTTNTRSYTQTSMRKMQIINIQYNIRKAKNLYTKIKYSLIAYPKCCWIKIMVFGIFVWSSQYGSAAFVWRMLQQIRNNFSFQTILKFLLCILHLRN